ncbi:MAG: TonB family protein [Bacteroidales bacterium]|jgi:TonB family protein|nr:TonB family protein [Bacteroidales bacterium]
MEKKNRLYGLIASAAVHGMILLWLLFTYLSTHMPPVLPPVYVASGGNGNFVAVYQPNGNAAAPPKPAEPQEKSAPQPTTLPPTEPQAKPKPQKPLITQEHERTAAIEDAKKQAAERRRQETERQTAARQREAEAERKRRAEAAKADAINRMAAGAFGQGAAASGAAGASGRGTTNTPGAGGAGTSFSLDGRTAEGLPRPAAVISEEGRIVVSITVNPNGNVIYAEITAGTNISDAGMRRSALEAARRSKFNSIPASNNQTGTITYKYSLR